MRNRQSDLLLTRTLVVVGAMVATTAFAFGYPDVSPVVSDKEPTQSPQERVKEVVVDFRAIAKEAIPAVVAIKVQSKQRGSPYGDGSDPFDLFGDGFWGFFNLPKRDSSRAPNLYGQASGVIVKPDGYILTNSHVVHGMDSIIVQLTDGREFPAKLLGEDPNSDLALIKVDGTHLPYLELGNSDALEVGQWVAAIGNPFGLQATLTTGVVSAKSRNNLDIARYEDFIQTDAAINRGNSGGPLLSLDGKVVGINAAIATNSSAGYVGIGFAIPSNMARHVMDEIIADGKVQHGYLGVALQSIDFNLAQAFGLKKVEGAIVANVLKGSPAEKAGLQVEDVILKYNHQPVENSAALRNAVYMMRPGTQISLTVLRKEETLVIPVTVGDLTEGGVSEKGALQNNMLGIEVESLTPELARSLGYEKDQGVVVSKVDPRGKGAAVGLKKGALILSVDRKKVSNIQEFNDVMRLHAAERPLLLQVKQDGNYLFVSMNLSH